MDRRRERLDLVVADVGREPERREPRLPEDLVRVGATDAGQRALVAEQRVELAPLAAEDLSQRRCVDVERVGTEVCELGVELRGCQEPHAGALLLARLGEEQLAAVREADLEHRLRRPFLARGQVAEPPGAHEVHPEDELAVGRREEEVLPAPAASLEAPAGERARRRVERLEGRDVARSCGLDGRTRDERIELPHPCLDLWQLGHALRVGNGTPTAWGGSARVLDRATREADARAEDERIEGAPTGLRESGGQPTTGWCD